MEKKLYSSEAAVDMVGEYLLAMYPGLREAAGKTENLRIRPVIFDELNYLFHSKGNHMVLFGGPWEEKTQALMGPLNSLALRYKVPNVHTFDFRVDSERETTDFKTDLTRQPSYDGPGKGEGTPAAEFNYVYGELVRRHLPNLDNFVKDRVGTGREVRYLDLYEELTAAPKLREPFLCITNREKGGIVAAVELADTPLEELGKRAEELFALTAEFPIASYSFEDYMREAFSRNERGHAFKTEDCFRAGEKINLVPVTLPILRWILRQEGSYAVLIAGAWCANSQAGVPTVNDYAVKNGVMVYTLDVRVDGKHPIDFWKYPRAREFRWDSLPTRDIYFDLWENELADAPVLVSMGRGSGWPRKPPVRGYEDENGLQHSMLGVDIPYFFTFNKDNMGSRGPKTVLDAVNHEGIELINCLPSFVYYRPNYRRYTAGVYRVMNTYCRSVGREAQELDFSRETPLAEGEPVRHVETVEHHRAHDWWKEL